MKLGDSLKKLRENKGYTQQQIADLIHTHRSGYSKMEINQQEIPVDCLIQIAKNFGMSVDDVIFFDEKNGVPNEVSMNDEAPLNNYSSLTN
jgi:transcriptional regulator with XRE-family HTH domain